MSYYLKRIGTTPAAVWANQKEGVVLCIDHIDGDGYGHDIEIPLDRISVGDLQAALAAALAFSQKVGVDSNE